MRLNDLFPTPVLVADIDKNIADDVESAVVSRQDKLVRHKDQNSDFHEKEKLFDLKNELAPLYNFFVQGLNAFVEQSGTKAVESHFTYWFQDYRNDGDHHGKHNHGTDGVSGIYWVRASGNAGQTVFYNPNVIMEYVHPTQQTKYNSTELGFAPRKGCLLLFPSYVNHSVLSSPKEAVRTTIAFNFGPAEV